MFKFRHITLIPLAILALFLTACSAAESQPAPPAPGASPTQVAVLSNSSPTPILVPSPTTAAIASSTPTEVATPTAQPSPTATPMATPAPSPTATATPSPEPTPTPDPYAPWTIEDLASRSYGGGQVEVQRVLAETGAFTRTLITYPSDGLTIYGFMNTPVGEGPFPVVIVVHGYVDPGNYNTVTYTARYADALARAGYLVLHPNLRGWPPSDSGPDAFRVGPAIDVLNLMAIVQATGGQPGALAPADPERIGLWGHSMGGGITQRVITVSDDVDAAVVYGSMSGDEALNHDRILYFTNGRNGLWDERPPDEALQRISPKYHLRRITAPVSIHHGTEDDQVPLEWSEDLCQWLQTLQKPVECFTYAGQPHTFVGEGDQLFVQRVEDFFDRNLRQGIQ